MTGYPVPAIQMIPVGSTYPACSSGRSRSSRMTGSPKLAVPSPLSVIPPVPDCVASHAAFRAPALTVYTRLPVTAVPLPPCPVIASPPVPAPLPITSWRRARCPSPDPWHTPLSPRRQRETAGRDDHTRRPDPPLTTRRLDPARGPDCGTERDGLVESMVAASEGRPADRHRDGRDHRAGAQCAPVNAAAVDGTGPDRPGRGRARESAAARLRSAGFLACIAAAWISVFVRAAGGVRR